MSGNPVGHHGSGFHALIVPHSSVEERPSRLEPQGQALIDPAQYLVHGDSMPRPLVVVEEDSRCGVL
eukprot:11218989-Lingulodinium_polyedra.AAC.1